MDYKQLSLWQSIGIPLLNGNVEWFQWACIWCALKCMPLAYLNFSKYKKKGPYKWKTCTNLNCFFRFWRFCNFSLGKYKKTCFCKMSLSTGKWTLSGDHTLFKGHLPKTKKKQNRLIWMEIYLCGLGWMQKNMHANQLSMCITKARPTKNWTVKMWVSKLRFGHWRASKTKAQKIGLGPGSFRFVWMDTAENQKNCNFGMK